jgi:hypothetical protein
MMQGRCAPACLLLALLFSLALAANPSTSKADVIVSVTTLNNSVAATRVSGQSVTTPNTGAGWDNITFNFYLYNAGSLGAAAATNGSLFLLNTAYSGTPAALSSSTTGYIATATGNGSVWTFNASVTLLPNTQYFFYAQDADGALWANNTGGALAGGNRYTATSTGTTFTATTDDMAFSLNGTPNPGPLPGSGLLSFAVLGFGAIAFRFNRCVAAARRACRQLGDWFTAVRPAGRVRA